MTGKTIAQYEAARRRRTRGVVAVAIVVVAAAGAAAVFWRPGGRTPATVATIPSPAAAPDSSAAESARARMRQDERRASAAQAPELARGLYTSAVSVRRSAEDAFTKRRFREAAVLFSEAGGLFDEARETAESAVPPETTETARADVTHPAPPPQRGSPRQEASPQSHKTPRATDDTPWLADLVASQGARSSAIDADAARYAPEEFTTAEALEREAHRLADGHAAGPAAARFRDATELYRRAARKAVEHRKDLVQEIEGLSALAASRRDELRDHAGMADYAAGAAALRHAGELRAAGDLPAAATSYREAVRRFDAVKAARKADDDAIRAVIADYGRALEHESLADLQRLHTTFPPSIAETWRRFFDEVHDLHATLDVDSLAFQKDGAAVADVGAVLRYAGASGSGKRNHWRMRLVKTPAGWRVDDINRKP